MNQVNGYTENDYDNDCYHYAGNNDHFVHSTLLRERKEFSLIKHKIHLSINISDKKAVNKLGKENFTDSYNGMYKYWIFEHKGEQFYYKNNEMEGSTIGIACDKKYEFDFKNSKLGEKLLEFEEELSNKLK